LQHVVNAVLHSFERFGINVNSDHSFTPHLTGLFHQGGSFKSDVSVRFAACVRASRFAYIVARRVSPVCLRRLRFTLAMSST
jgi:hypothetical protein